MVGVIKDITEKKRVEEELTNYREHLEELVKQRSAIKGAEPKPCPLAMLNKIVMLSETPQKTVIGPPLQS
jgi:hypothetical protein